MRLALSLALTVWPCIANAGAFSCPEVDVTVEGGADLAPRICETADLALASLETCGLHITRPIVISVATELSENCVGHYICGSDRISVLHPDTLAQEIADSTLFSQLTVLEYFDSIVFHELVHAAYDEVPCPFPHCSATSEYLAYALQIRELSPDARTRIGFGEVPEEKVSGAFFSAIIAFWAPDVFARKAWTHLMQRPDPCAYVSDLAAGKIYFDTETPHIIAPPE